jgi:hypothetical protein
MTLDELVLTPSSLLSILSEIEELKGKDITFVEHDNNIVLTIDESEYIIDTSNASTVETDGDTVQEVSEANEEGYANLDESISFEDDDEPVEGGIIKELAKTLLVGGLVRLTSNAIKNG